MQFLGLGKTKFNSSVCLIDDNKNEIEVLLTERINRKKNSGLWPEAALKKVSPQLDKSKIQIGENGDVHKPSFIENIKNQKFPFYEYLKNNSLDSFLTYFNPSIYFISHHLAHANAALALSPFSKSIIVVMDGAGSETGVNLYEECTIYLQDGVVLRPVFKRPVSFISSKKNQHHRYGSSLGSAYEKASDFIFGSPNSSGKVMGLASFGNVFEFKNYFEFQEQLPWDKAFKGNSKKEWEELDHNLFKNIAATIQMQLEKDYADIILMIKKLYPEYRNLILTGGCALNCTNNAKIFYQNNFDKIFIPPFPGDECIGFGVAHALKYQSKPGSWRAVPFEKQSAYFGPSSSIPTPFEINLHFPISEYCVEECLDVTLTAAELLKDGKIIAWFQGRSESGPRSLGNRSILVRPDIKGIKDYLNNKIKFREEFRPYGCSVLFEKADKYFEVGGNFDNPYMSYAIKIRAEFKNILKEVSHIDGTSRMQTVRLGQNEKFYKLIENFGNISGLFCLLNTSLNIMDEPILETIQDAKFFLNKVPVDCLVIENFIIKKRS